MIESFELKFGATAGGNSTAVPCTPVTIFVGPNNSGKTKILEEMRRVCSGQSSGAERLILKEITLCQLSEDEGRRCVEFLKSTERLMQVGDKLRISDGSMTTTITPALLKKVFSTPQEPRHRASFCQFYLKAKTLFLDGRSRLKLVEPQAAGNFQKPTTTLSRLFTNDDRRERLRRIVLDAFGTHLVIDPTEMGKLKVRLSSRAPVSASEERGIDAAAVSFHGAAQLIESASDGIKAFTGSLIALLAEDPEIVLIDEPEAFLHPPLATKLGKELSLAAQEGRRRLFASTHSANFVMGCIQAGAPATIIRLTFKAGVGTARVLPSEDIVRLMRNPLLRSTGTLQGLFFESVVVTESDADRAFYQEVNERLLRSGSPKAIRDCLFINAQNKQTVAAIVRPLRDLGIPVAAVVDIDILCEGGTVWQNFLACGFIPELQRGQLGQYRAAIHAKYQQLNLNAKREGGIDALSGDDRNAAQNLLDELGRHGLFVVPHGELESWLPKLQATGHGPGWLIDIFQRMGEDPSAPDFVRPEEGDVWDFVGNMNSWLSNENRKGIPE